MRNRATTNTVESRALNPSVFVLSPTLSSESGALGSCRVHPCRRSHTDSGAVGRLPGPLQEIPPVPVMGGRAGAGRGSDYSSKELSAQVLRSLRNQLRENTLWELRAHS